MLLISSSLIKHELTFTRLTDCMEYLPVTARWAEGEWGYIRNKGVEYREGVMNLMKDDVYIGTLAGQPVAMFAVFEHAFHADLTNAPGAAQLPHARELMYVYVENDYRGLGFGRQIIDEAKRLARAAGADLILLDTLKPGLNRMYEKQGAEMLCEHHLFSHGTDVFSMKI